MVQTHWIFTTVALVSVTEASCGMYYFFVHILAGDICLWNEHIFI